jgi:hypothetical protein
MSECIVEILTIWSHLRSIPSEAPGLGMKVRSQGQKQDQAGTGGLHILISQS